jgi:hypothetical protein
MLKKKPTPGLCHWSRCQTAVTEPNTLCPKHTSGLVVDNALTVSRNEALELLTAVSTVGLTDMVEVEDRSVSGLAFLGLAREHARVLKADLEKARKVEKEPHLRKGQEVDALYKPATDTCQAVVKACTDRLEAYAKELAAEQRKALEAVAQAAVAGDMALAKVEHSRAQGLAPELPDTVRLYTEIGFELDLDEVPEEVRVVFELLDEAKVKAYGKACQGTIRIPGIRWTRVEKVRTA